jgi:hypothetical protein
VVVITKVGSNVEAKPLLKPTKPHHQPHHQSLAIYTLKMGEKYQMDMKEVVAEV